MGFSIESVKKALQTIERQYEMGSADLSAKEMLVNVLLDTQDSNVGENSAGGALSINEDEKVANDVTVTSNQAKHRKEDDGLCKICFASESDCVLLPCSHLLMCFSCSRKVQVTKRFVNFEKDFSISKKKKKICIK